MTGFAFVFPGEGSQYPGMAGELVLAGPAAVVMVDDAECITGLPLLDLMVGGSAAELAHPQVAQLCVFLHSTAFFLAMEDEGLTTRWSAGHGLGEYSAMVAAGMLSWTDALLLVSERGRLMADAASARIGDMAVVHGLPVREVEALCVDASALGSVVVAAVDSPRRSVVSGDLAAVEDVVSAALDRGAIRAHRLSTGGARHSPLMASAQTEFEAALHWVRLDEPRLAMVSSVTGERVTDPEVQREALLGQLTAPVRWAEAVSCLRTLGAPGFIEVGPGRGLTDLGQEIAPDLRALALPDFRAQRRTAPAPRASSPATRGRS